jgi:hypothetical protein
MRQPFCDAWGEAHVLGALPPELQETSGLALSTAYPGRRYYVRDSGNGLGFYYSDPRKGVPVVVGVRVGGYAPYDVEDIDLGPCTDTEDCLFLADIGDNHLRRTTLEVVAIKELPYYPLETAWWARLFRPAQVAVTPFRRIKLRYPGRPANAESIGVHPNGDLFIFTKARNGRQGEVCATEIFWVAREEWQMARDDVVLPVHRLGEIDLRLLLPGAPADHQVISSVDISPAGDRFLAITYGPAIEFSLNLADQWLPPTGDLQEGIDYRVIPIPPVPAQESVSYTPDGRGFVYCGEMAGQAIRAVHCVSAR